MRQYLISFWESFSYMQEDAAVLLGAYDRIIADERANEAFVQALALYDADVCCDYATVIRLADEAARMVGVHEYTGELLVFMCLSKRLKARYVERGIDEAIFYNSLLDLRYKLEECKAVRGIVGSFVAWWFAGFFDLTRFAFGRLQFEMIDFGDSYEKDGRVLEPQSRVINVHIPRTGAPLDEQSCRAAYKAATLFFRREAGENPAFVCNSWLLYPENEILLPPHSNIRTFMRRYNVYKWQVDKNGSDLWRLFDTDEKHPDRLPTDSSLRRAYVTHLKNGGALGWGRGVFFASDC